MRKQIASFLLSFGLLFASPLAAEPLRITAFGDSLVQGFGLPQGQGLVPQLEAWLRAAGADVALTNAGVSGDTTAGGAARIAWTLADQPDGLIVLLGGNDLLRGAAPEQTAQNLTQILETAQTQGVPVVLIGMEAPLNYGAEYKAQFDAIYPRLAQEFDAWLMPNAFVGMIAAAGDAPSALQSLMQADGIHPNRDGVAANVAVLGPIVQEMLESIGG